MYFEKKYFKYFHTYVFQNTILNTFGSQYFKKYFKYFSHSIFSNTGSKVSHQSPYMRWRWGHVAHRRQIASAKQWDSLFRRITVSKKIIKETYNASLM